MKIKLWLSFVIFLCSPLSQATESAYKIRWVLAHEPARVFERAAKNFASSVEKNSQGRIQVEVIDSKTLNQGKPLYPSQAFEMVQKGELQMSQTYTTSLGRYHKDLWVFDLPYLFKDHAHAAKILDGPIGTQIASGLETQGVKGLGFTYSGGFRIIPTHQKPIASLKDFKNMKISVSQDSPIAVAYLKELGAIPVQVRDIQAYQSGLDGFETTYARLESVKGQDSKYINETEHSLFLTAIIINKDFFDKLPTDLQKVVREAAHQAAVEEREDSIRDGLESKEKYRKSGLKIVEIPIEEKKKMQDAALKIHKKYEKFFDSNLIAEIKKAQ